ncbi:hypothetical protein MHBO_002334 [Bonamia ostreae]|uniref:THIF-type NAD/FAD binding fold domain-containing protein n=1 Tax=Bonamia ostreae TaxID=126728 RepID=A0ABV2ALZ6_9EUKA
MTLFGINKNNNFQHILLIGAGGIGGELLKNLSIFNFAKVTIVDHDKIEASNLPRQLYFRKSDLNFSKIAVLAQKLKSSKLIFFENDIRDFEIHFFDQFDLVISCVDNIETRRYTANLLFQKYLFCNIKIPFFDCGSEGFAGQLRIYEFDKGPCFDCTKELFKSETDSYPLCSKNLSFEEAVLATKKSLFPSTPKEKLSILQIEKIHEAIMTKKPSLHSKFNSLEKTKSLLKSVVVPTLNTTNSIIAGICSVQIKNFGNNRNNLFTFNGEKGAYFANFELRKNENCVCANFEKICLKVKNGKGFGIPFLKKNLKTEKNDFIKFYKSKFGQTDYFCLEDSCRDKILRDRFEELIGTNENFMIICKNKICFVNLAKC